MSMKRDRALILRHRGLSLRLWPRPLLSVLGLALLLVALALWSLAHGSAAIPKSTVLGYLGLGGTAPTPGQELMLDAFRAPRICLAMLCGAMLALAGAAMQDLVRNGLADPGLLGMREAVALAILGLMLLVPGAGPGWQMALGLAGGLTSGALVLWLARGATGLRFLLIGLALSWFLSSLLVIVMTTASDSQLQRALIWLAGDLQLASWQAVALAAPLFLAGLALLLALTPGQSAEELGPELALSLGSRPALSRPLRFLAAIVLVTGAVTVGGSFGFIGLIAPHLARALPGRGSPACRLIATALTGALLVLAADSIGRLAFGRVEIPAGIVLTGLGGPTMILLLWQRRRYL